MKMKKNSKNKLFKFTEKQIFCKETFNKTKTSKKQNLLMPYVCGIKFVSNVEYPVEYEHLVYFSYRY